MRYWNKENINEKTAEEFWEPVMDMNIRDLFSVMEELKEEYRLKMRNSEESKRERNLLSYLIWEIEKLIDQKVHETTTETQQETNNA